MKAEKFEKQKGGNNMNYCQRMENEGNCDCRNCSYTCNQTEEMNENEMVYKFTRQELKNKKASDFKEGDVIKTGIYYIHIHYQSKDGKHKYDRPSLCSYHEREDFKPCGCTPGADRPYYIDDFINR